MDEDLIITADDRINGLFDFPEDAKIISQPEITPEKLAEHLANISTTEEIPDNNTYYEGSVQQITVNTYERNAKARKSCIEYYGTSCFVCGFDFSKVYGELGDGFIHVHHLYPVSEIKHEYQVNPINDLRPVCPNCHAMIHRRIPPLSINQLQDVLNNAKLQPG